MFEVFMPKLSQYMEEGIIACWLKSEGDPVEKGEPLLEVETDKAIVVVESPASGTLWRILSDQDDTVPVAEVLAYVLLPGEDPPKDEALAGAELSEECADLRSPHPSPTTDAAVKAASPELDGKTRIVATPRARKLARELGIELVEVEGTGSGGRITEQDVVSFSQLSSADRRRVLEPSRLQLIAAERITESFASIPHFYIQLDVRADKLLGIREQLMPLLAQQVQVRPTVTDLLVAIVAQLLERHELLNASWSDDKIIIAGQTNIGVATSIPDGLVVPVIQRANQLSFAQIVSERHRLVTAAMSGKLSPGDLDRGTFTISNLGMYGVDSFGAIINLPQSAILAVGRIAERPVVENGVVTAAPTLKLTLSLDHRVVDGVKGAEFARDLGELIEQPSKVAVLTAIVDRT